MRAMIVANPAAGQLENRVQLDTAVEILRTHGWEVVVEFTAQPGDATHLAAKAVHAGYDAVFGAGGDGTLNEILQVLVDSPTALGVLPVGTANIWAREIDVPLEPVGAATTLAEGHVRLMDVCLAEYQQGKRYFFLLASVGYDAAVTGKINRDLKRHFGMLAYIVTAFQLVFSYVGTPVRLSMNRTRRRVRLLFGVFSNTRIYGGLVRLSPDACADDGFIDIDIFRGRGWWQTMVYYASIALGRHRALPSVETYRARSVAVSARRPLAVQLDGDPVGTTPLRLTCLKRRLRVLVPAGTKTGLFQQEAESDRSLKKEE